MSTDIFESGKAPLIEIRKCEGDLAISPWMELAIKPSGEYSLNQTDEGYVFDVFGDLKLEVPENSIIKVGQVLGDLAIKNIQGELSIDEVHGDVILSNISQAKINRIHSDLLGKSLQGPIYIDGIDGDVVLRNVDNDVFISEVFGDLTAYFINGDFTLKQVLGDVNLRTVNGDINIESVHRDANFRNLGGVNSINKVFGDIRLHGGLTPGKHKFVADGDIVVRWPIDAPIELFASASTIKNSLPLVDIEEIGDSLSGRLGFGETVVNLTAKGKILLKEDRLVNEKWDNGNNEPFGMDFMFDLAGLGERVSAEVNQHLSRLTNHLENNFGPEFAQNISRKFSYQAEKAARQAEKAADRARRYAEREAARAEKRNYQSEPARQAYQQPVEEKRQKVSTEEQLKILKMVENGTISPEEASTLLEAMEG